MRRLAASLGAREVVTVGPPGFEEVRARVTQDGQLVELGVQRSAGVLARAEFVVGHAPAEEPPPLSLHRRGAPRLGRRDGREIETGDTAFDALFSTWDARRLAGPDPLLDDATRTQLREVVDGWLAVWPGRGARFRTVGPRLFALLVDESAAGDEAVRAVAALLVEIQRRDGSTIAD